MTLAAYTGPPIAQAVGLAVPLVLGGLAVTAVRLHRSGLGSGAFRAAH